MVSWAPEPGQGEGPQTKLHVRHLLLQGLAFCWGRHGLDCQEPWTPLETKAEETCEVDLDPTPDLALH